MKRAARRLGAVLLAVAITLAVAGLSRAPYRISGEDEALLRLSWRMRAERAGECRRPTEEELEALPPHMRNPDACVGPVRPFRLHVRLDGRTVLDERIRPAGARGDRPVYVFRQVPLEPGEHRVRIAFRQEEHRDEPVGAGGPPAGGEAVRLDLRRTLRVGPREIVLVTLGGEGGELVVRRGGER